MSNIVIDPKMFSLTEEKQIESNLEFYLILFDLIQKGKIRVCIYPEVEKLLEGVTAKGTYFPPPFPIDPNDISNPQTKQTCEGINNMFARVIVNQRSDLEIFDCGGKMDYHLNSEYADDTDLKNLGGYLLTNCYSSRLNTEKVCNKIVSGKKEDGQMIRTTNMTVHCSCDIISEFSDTFSFVWPDALLSPRDSAIETLTKMYSNHQFEFCANPIFQTDGDHHFYGQSTPPKKYSDLSRANRSVLKHLQYFGLMKVHFHEASEGFSGRVGEIKVLESYDPHQSSRIVEGWLLGETNSSVKVDLYFPELVGELIVKSVGKSWNLNAIRNLKNDIIP